MWRVVRVVIILIVLVFAFPKSAVGSELVSFSNWKNKKIAESKSLVGDLKQELKQSRKSPASDIRDLEQKIIQAESNLSMAKELTANDYWVLYVFPNFGENRQALEKAAKSLKPNDIVEILDGYGRQMKAADFDRILSQETSGALPAPL